MIKLFNTLTRKIEDFKPQSESRVTVYTCGPTVYDHAHIGHWFTYVRMDILIRTLLANNYNPFWVMNITDVGHLTSDADEGEDKVQQKAQKEKKNAWEIAEQYSKEFFESMHQLNILEPNLIVKATDHIEDQINFINKLEEKGYCYTIGNDGLYFDISKFKAYPDFARLDLDEQQAGKRVLLNPLKRNPQDFALWKFSPKNQHRDMEWDSPWGRGFPGWHIECSAMSMKYLGETLDIHTGGIDHIPVHHTNEIAQSQSLTNKPLANYWMHSNHLMINGQKISKSLHNGITLDQLMLKGYRANEIRLHILESHYQSQSRFSYESLDSARNRLNNIKAMVVLRFQSENNVIDYPTFSFTQAFTNIKDLISNNLNTPQVLALLSEITDQIIVTGLSKDKLDEFEAFIISLDKLLGLELYKVPDISLEDKELISKRETTRKENDFESADKIRLKLENHGLILRDSKNGTHWQWKD